MIKNNSITNQSRDNLLIILGSIFIGVIYLYRIKYLNSIVIINDEFGYWGIAAFLSGKKWSTLLSTTPYYSFGYSLLLVPLYLFNLEPSMMYQMAIIINVLLIIGSYGIALLCSKELAEECDFRIRWLICLTISFYTNNIIQAQIAWTETLLYFLIWLLFYIFIRNTKCLSYRNLLAGIIISIYMYTVHQRTIGVLLVYLGLTFCNILINKKGYYKVLVGMIIVISLLLIQIVFKNYFIDNLFSNNELVTMNNIQGQTGKVTNILTTSSGFVAFIKSIVGKFYYISVASLYIAPIGIFIGFINIIQEIKRTISLKKIQYNTVIYVELFAILSFLSLLTISAISMYVNKGRLDLLIYGRYMEVAVGPILLIGLLEFNKKKKVTNYILVLIGIVFIITFFVDQGLIDSESSSFNSTCASVLYYFFKQTSEIPGLAFKITILTLIPLLLFILLKNKKIKYIAYSILIIVWISLGSFSGPIEQQEYIVKTVNPIVDILKEEEESIEQIYFINSDTEITDSQTYIKYLQYFEQDYDIKETNRSELEEKRWGDGSYIICDSKTEISPNMLKKFYIKEKTPILTLLCKR